VTDPTTRTAEQRRAQIRVRLGDHGPQTTRELQEAIGVKYNTLMLRDLHELEQLGFITKQPIRTFRNAPSYSWRLK
jgi:DNA-binding HxlR family transcriptional regulator